MKKFSSLAVSLLLTSSLMAVEGRQLDLDNENDIKEHQALLTKIYQEAHNDSDSNLSNNNSEMSASEFELLNGKPPFLESSENFIKFVKGVRKMDLNKLIENASATYSSYFAVRCHHKHPFAGYYHFYETPEDMKSRNPIGMMLVNSFLIPFIDPMQSGNQFNSFALGVDFDFLDHVKESSQINSLQLVQNNFQEKIMGKTGITSQFFYTENDKVIPMPNKLQSLTINFLTSESNADPEDNDFLDGEVLLMKAGWKMSAWNVQDVEFEENKKGHLQLMTFPPQAPTGHVFQPFTAQGIQFPRGAQDMNALENVLIKWSKTNPDDNGRRSLVDEYLQLSSKVVNSQGCIIQ